MRVYVCMYVCMYSMYDVGIKERMGCEWVYSNVCMYIMNVIVCIMRRRRGVLK